MTLTENEIGTIQAALYRAARAAALSCADGPGRIAHARAAAAAIEVAVDAIEAARMARPAI